VGDLEVTSGYVELKYLFPAGLYLAGRFDSEQFGEISDSGGNRRPWDLDVTRYEFGAGYRFDSSVRAKLVYQGTTLESGQAGVANREYGLVAAQLSIGF
jgi:hypothetical protein